VGEVCPLIFLITASVILDYMRIKEVGNMRQIEKVKECVSGCLAKKGVELVDLIYRKEGGDMVLRILVDTAEGVTLGQCEEINRELSDLFDNENIIENHYILEVSSPGLDRHLKSDSDFIRLIGKGILVTTFEPIDGRREHEGVLVGLETEQIVIEQEGVSTVIPRAKIAKAVQKIEF